MRSLTMMTVGWRNAAIMRIFCAANTISSDLPDPWKCQISPFLILFSTVRAMIMFAPSYCW